MSALPTDRSSCDRVAVDRASTETALAAEWSRANLASYGAALRAEGDPRGELILAELDPQTDYVSDWLPFRDRLDGVDEVRATLA